MEDLGGLHALIPLVQKQWGPSPLGCFWCERQRCFSDANVFFSPQRGGWPGWVLAAPLLARSCFASLRSLGPWGAGTMMLALPCHLCGRGLFATDHEVPTTG